MKELIEELRISLKETTDYKYSIDESSIVGITNQKGIITHANDNFCKISKYSREELIGQDHRMINSGYHSKDFISALWATIGNGKIWKGELKNKAKDGTIYWVDTTIVPFLNEQGKPYQYIAIRSDITERKKAEDNLKESIKEITDYKYALEESSIIAITDQKGIIIHANDNFCKISKYSREELIGKDHLIINSGYHSKDFMRNLWLTIANGEIWKGEIKNNAKDGSSYWVDTTIVPFLNEFGKPYKYIAIRSDITERKRVEALLNEHHKLLSQSKETSKLAVELIAANKELVFQHTEKEKRASELIDANIELNYQSREKEKRAQELTIANKELLFQNDEKEKRAGELIIANAELDFQNNEKEKRAGVLLIANKELLFQNNEKEKRSAELSETLDRVSFLATIAENIQDPVISTDNNFITTRWNKAAEKTFEWTSEEVVGKVNRDILTVNYLERTIEIIEALNEGKSWQGELIYFTKSGKQINGLTTVSLLKNAEGNKIGTITLIRDITARKKVEMALSKLNEELEDRVKERTGVIEKVFSEKNSILESIGDAFFAFDRNWIVTYWNRIAEIEFGADKLKVIDNQLWAIFPKSNTPKSYEKYHLALESNKVVHFEEYFASSNKWYEISAFPSKIGLSVYLRNVTERKITEQKVRDSEARLKEAQAFAHISNWEMDLVTNINIWSDEFYNILEIRHGDVEPSPEAFLTVIHPDDVIRITKFLEVIFQTHENASFSARVNTKSGIAKYIYAEGKFEFDENKKPIRLYGILMDVTEKTVYEETIKQSEFQIRNFAKHLTKMQEEERAHIAREIHDELGQQFVGIKIGLSSFLKINNILPEVKNNVINMMSSVDTAIQSLRKIATELRPGILDTLGLAVSIEWLVKEFERKTGIPCKIDMNVKEQIFGKDISICLFRICQEALTNISKHAECSKVRVVFLKNEDELLLQIIDNGKGMSSEKLANPFSMGLLGIRERANNIGGQLEVVSKKGEGTKIQITVNIN